MNKSCEYIKIGNVKIDKSAALAPMASVADRAFREICKDFKASYVVSELVSSKGVSYNDKKSKKLLYVGDKERPMGVQLFGDDPDIMAKATIKALEYNPDIIDINMGCPVPKVAGNGSGSALMRTPSLAFDIVKEVVAVSTVPVTVKIRKGWDKDSVNAVEFAQLMEKAGASAITVHGRTKDQMYRPYSDNEIIKKVKQAVSVPVIGNGDVDSVQSAIAMYEQTNCDLVMIGRATYGNPFIFREIHHYLTTGTLLEPPTLEEKLEVMISHIRLLCEYNTEKMGMKEARKHAGWYLKGIHGAAAFRGECGKLTYLSDLEKLVEQVNTNIQNSK